MSNYYYKTTNKVVRPMMSSDFCEARRRALGLYRAIYRYIPHLPFEKPGRVELERVELQAWLYMRSDNFLTVRVIWSRLGNILHANVFVKRFDIPKNEEDCRWMLRSYFYKHACITDIRVIDVLVIKGYMELKELTENWQQKGHVMRHWNPSIEPKPVTFLEKFVAGVD